MSYSKTVLEVFAGAGGMSLGFEKSGFNHTMLVENDRQCVNTLSNNRLEWNVNSSDITKVRFASRYANVVAGGFPCQSFSHVGKRLGFEDVRGTLFYEFARTVKEVSPKIFVAENVPGILTNDGGNTVKTIVSVLESLGYSVAYKMLNSVQFNVPQKRKRVFFVGTKDGIEFRWPEPVTKNVTLRDALKNVPESIGASYSENRKEIFDLVPPGGCWINLPKDMQKSYLGKSYGAEGGMRGMARRLSWDEPCLTLTCSPAQKITERIHPDETRPFTVREYARIQTFPDSWEFSGNMYGQYKQIGNAVPVNLALYVAKSVGNALAQ